MHLRSHSLAAAKSGCRALHAKGLGLACCCGGCHAMRVLLLEHSSTLRCRGWRANGLRATWRRCLRHVRWPAVAVCM
jgi:hypothetical protein